VDQPVPKIKKLIGEIVPKEDAGYIFSLEEFIKHTHVDVAAVGVSLTAIYQKFKRDRNLEGLVSAFWVVDRISRRVGACFGEAFLRHLGALLAPRTPDINAITLHQTMKRLPYRRPKWALIQHSYNTIQHSHSTHTALIRHPFRKRGNLHSGSPPRRTN
jgi:hypothetical protein